MFVSLPLAFEIASRVFLTSCLRLHMSGSSCLDTRALCWVDMVHYHDYTFSLAHAQPRIGYLDFGQHHITKTIKYVFVCVQ